MVRLGKHCIMGVVGNEGDSIRFAEFIKSNMKLYEIQNGFSMNFKTMVHFTRNHLVNNLRTNPNCRVAMLLAGCDPHDGPNLHYIDMKGSAQSLNYSGHGIGNTISSSIFRTLWRPDINRDQAYEIVKKCVSEIQNRLVVNLRNFEVFVVDADGILQMESLNYASMNKPKA